MSLDRVRLIDLAASTGFRRETLEKVDRLIGLLDDVCRHPLLSRVLALKGGTALNLGFGPPARLSVDLDFNYVGATDRPAMLDQRPEVERAIKGIARSQGLRLQRSRDAHAGNKYFLTYRSVFGSEDHVEIDLNFLHRVSLVPTSKRSLWRPDGEKGPGVPVVGLDELSAGKLCALLDRTLPRDCYDVIRLPAVVGDLRDPRRRHLFIALAGAMDRPLYDYGESRFERVTQAVVADQLHPMLSGNDRPTAEYLRQETWNVVGPLLDLSAEEREYSERMQIGELRPELLFPRDEAMIHLLRSHPVLLWKAGNAKAHAGTSKEGRMRAPRDRK